MIEVLGRNTSSNVMKVMWAAAEIGLPVERRDVGGTFGGNDTSDYLALNPNGLVPTLRDGEVVLWESNVIVRYLAARHDSGGLWPDDPATRADGERWMDWQQTVLNPAFGPVFMGLIRTPEPERDMAAIERAIETTGAKLAMLDAWLAKRPFVGGDRLTMSDIPPGPTVHRWFGMDIERRELPNLRAWYDRLLERPGFREHVTSIPIA